MQTSQKLLSFNHSRTKRFRKILSRLYEYSGTALVEAYLRSTFQKDAVFIWIPKTAGTSLFSLLGSPKLKHLHLAQYRFANKGRVTFSHMDYARLLEEGYVSRRFDKSAFKFAFCRNPYDRTVSLYHYLRNYLKRIPADESFLAFCRRLKDEGCEPIGLYNSKGLSQCNPQVRWVENVNLDFLGKFEAISEDATSLLKELELPVQSLPHLRRTSRSDYKNYYCVESRELVEDIYSEDFRFFDYKTEQFSGSESVPPVISAAMEGVDR